MDQANEDLRRDADDPQRQDPSAQPRQRHISMSTPPPPSYSTSHGNGPPPPPSGGGHPALDPTGMFRNRGRRVVARSRVAAHGNNHRDGSSAMIVPSSPLAPPPTLQDPPPSRSRRHRHRGDHPDAVVVATSSAKDRNGDELADRAMLEHRSRRLDQLGAASASTSSGEEVVAHYLDPATRNGMPDFHVDAMRFPGRRPMVHRKEEEPEIDHPPQSMSLMNVSNAGDYNISCHMQGNDADHEIMVGDNAPPRSSDICRSNDSDDSAERAPSAVGSTVSVMGSAAGDDDGDYSSAHDDARLLAVRMRMMQDVEEVSEGGMDEDERENGESAANDSMHDDDDENMNDISLECHADTNTSYLEDHSIVDARSSERNADDIISDDHSINDARRTERETNVVKVADFSDSSTVVDANGNTPPPIHNIHVAHETQSRQGQESPFRAAFRRSAQEMSNRLPLMSPQMLSAAAAAATPGRFQRSAAASSAMDRAATTASLLPQFARQCFSFEDTTVDDDVFLAVPDRLRAGGGGGGGGEGGHATTHEYYGLSAVASFVVGEHDDDDGSVNDDDRHHRAGCGAPPAREYRASSSGRRGRSSCGGGEPDSPFRVIRESRTWGGDVPQSSSFDAWSLDRGGPNQHLGGGIQGTVDSFPIEEGKRKRVEKDWRVSSVLDARHVLIAN